VKSISSSYLKVSKRIESKVAELYQDIITRSETVNKYFSKSRFPVAIRGERCTMLSLGRCAADCVARNMAQEGCHMIAQAESANMTMLERRKMQRLWQREQLIRSIQIVMGCGLYWERYHLVLWQHVHARIAPCYE
jgi:hypothetical protein